MNCEEFRDYLDAYIDNELDVAATIAIKQHLRDCVRCQQFLEARRAVGVLLRQPEVRFAVPDSLLGKVQSILPAPGSNVKQPSASRFILPWFSIPLAVAATVAVILGVVFLKQGGISDRLPGKTLAQEVISSHVRSMLATHLLDVPSTDQHTVKPWFNGKLKFSPPVHDFADRGFRLIGGRLDYFNGREVAALIYQHNQHIINLFVWPAESGGNNAAQSLTKDGYHVSHWEYNGFEFWAVSDVNMQDLASFADLQMQQS